MEQQIIVMPVTKWQIGQAPGQQLGLMRFAFLSQAVQAVDEADQSPIYGLSIEQMRSLASALMKTADQLQTGAPPGNRPQPAR